MSVSGKPFPADGSHLLESGAESADVRQPSVEGLHSPSSPSAPTAIPKPGIYIILDVCRVRRRMLRTV